MQRFLSQIQQKSVSGLSGESSHTEPVFPNSDQAFPDLTLADSPEERRLISSFGRKVMRASGQGASLPGHTLGHRTQHTIGSWLMRFGGRGADIWYAPRERSGEREGPGSAEHSAQAARVLPATGTTQDLTDMATFWPWALNAALGPSSRLLPTVPCTNKEQPQRLGTSFLSVKSQNPQTIAERGETRHVPRCKHSGVLFS